MISQSKNPSSDSLIIILLGPPGSGKGTQAVMLSATLKIPHLSTGDLFRANIAQNTDLGRKAKVFINEGQLVPDELVLEMLFSRVQEPDCYKGYLLDGFPRTIAQAEALDLKITSQSPMLVLNLHVRDEVVIKRIEGRLSCEHCGYIQNKYFSKPRCEGLCDQCGGPLFQRSDDREDVVRERLKVYYHQTEPLIEYYSKKKLLASIDGERSSDLIFQDLFGLVTKANKLDSL